MVLDLEYFKVYDLNIAGKYYKGVYIGQKNTKRKFSFNYFILVNYFLRRKKENFCIFRFKDFRFKDNKMIMRDCYRVEIPKHQKPFYDNLLEIKLKNDYIRVFEQKPKDK